MTTQHFTPQQKSTPVFSGHILNLNDPSDAAFSQKCSGPVFWISAKPPQAQLGALAEDFQGAWLEPMKLHVRIDGVTVTHELPQSLASQAPALLKPVLARHLAGESPNRIQASLRDDLLFSTHI
jgi:hypothetical protein